MKSGFKLISLLSIVFVSAAVHAESYPVIQTYRSLAEKLIASAATAQTKKDFQSLKTDSQNLVQAGVEMMKLYKAKNPLCSAQIDAFLAALPEMESKSLEEVHTLYHNGTGLPMAPRFCYLGRSQVIHPVMNVIRLQGVWNEEVRRDFIADLEEVIEHLERVQTNLDNPPQDPSFEKGKQTLQSMTGCYLVDYSYTETEGIQSGYERDKRVYDVNKDKSVKEWIYSEEISPSRIRLQHILFATNLEGKIAGESFLKHQSEDWEYNASFLYDFSGPSTWTVKDLRGNPGQWTRRITNLDDGLRYQCAASWNLMNEFPEWTCDNYAPIPGRETRDMGRKDYNALQRSTKIVAYGSSWLERQVNTKILDKDGVKTPIAKELGKNWYVRLPDSECDSAKAFVAPRQSFWTLLRETWDKVLNGEGNFVEKAGQPPRFVKMFGVEAEFSAQDLKDPAVRSAAEKKILDLIQEYRAQ